MFRPTTVRLLPLLIPRDSVATHHPHPSFTSTTPTATPSRTNFVDVMSETASNTTSSASASEVHNPAPNSSEHQRGRGRGSRGRVHGRGGRGRGYGMGHGAPTGGSYAVPMANPIYYNPGNAVGPSTAPYTYREQAPRPRLTHCMSPSFFPLLCVAP